MKKTLNINTGAIALGILFLISVIGCNSDGSVGSDSYVTITPKKVYFEVNIDYSTGNRYSIGKEYGGKVLDVFPDYEKEMESLLVETVIGLNQMDPEITYDTLIERALEISINVQPQYMEEIEGFASVLSGKTTNVLGDGKISRDEFLMLNFDPDIATTTSCSCVAVYGERSVTGQTIIGRNTDWFPGTRGQMGYMHAVVYVKIGTKQVVSFGFLGMIGSLVAINSDGVFVANLYSSIDAPYSALGKRSILLDIREAIETSSTVEEVGAFLADTSRLYGYNNNMFIADKNVARVLENDFERYRAMRSEDSELNPGITWGISDAITCVNAFVLKGNFDNFTGNPGNTERWANFKRMLIQEGDKVNIDDIKTIMSYHKPGAGGDDDGDIYWNQTIQSLAYSFSDNRLELWLHPPTGEFNDKPVFVTVPIPFLAAQAETVTVARVIDGDTCILENDERVRYYGINAPEKGDPQFNEATQANNNLVAGKEVRLEPKNPSRDENDRLLAYVFVDEIFVNEELLRLGSAHIQRPLASKYRDRLLRAQESAQQEGLGIWAKAAEQGVVIAEVHADAEGNDWDNLCDEYIVIENKGDISLDLTGWTVYDEAHHRYLFPNIILEAGATVTLRTCLGKNTQSELFWGSRSPIWNNDGDTIFIRDSQDQLVLSYVY